MVQEIQDQNFLDGFAVGEFTGRLKYQTPLQIKEWVPLDKIKNFKSVLRKYNYSITGVSAHLSDPNQVLLAADKIAEEPNHKMILAFASGDIFMDGWEAGCLSMMLRCLQPEQVNEWVKVSNLDAIQKVVDKCGYAITSLHIHPEYKKWAQLVAQKKPIRDWTSHRAS